MNENFYRKLGTNDLSLPKRIMRFISDRSVVKKIGQGAITIVCPELWEMTDDEFALVFGVEFNDKVEFFK